MDRPKMFVVYQIARGKRKSGENKFSECMDLTSCLCRKPGWSWYPSGRNFSLTVKIFVCRFGVTTCSGVPPFTGGIR